MVRGFVSAEFEVLSFSNVSFRVRVRGVCLCVCVCVCVEGGGRMAER